MGFFTSYLEFTRTTAIYPEHTDLPAWGFYLPLGLADEAGELLEKVMRFVAGEDLPPGKHKEGIVAEIGDVMWYAARLADHHHANLDELAITEYIGKADLLTVAAEVSIHAAYIAGRAKKIIRDGDAGRGERQSEQMKALGNIIAACRAVGRFFNEPLQNIMWENQKKLVSRQQRGVLQGNGDNR